MDDQGTNPYRSGDSTEGPVLLRFPWYATTFHVGTLGTCLAMGVYLRGIKDPTKFCISSSVALCIPFFVAASLAVLPKLFVRRTSFQASFYRALAFAEIALGCFMALMAFFLVMNEVGDPLGLVPSWF